MFTILATQVKTNVTYRVSFATETQAVDFVNRKSSTHCFGVEDDFDDRAAALLTEALWPTCEHGLTLQFCGGPMHWYDR
jgi:hypothetical protein